jgi:imidazole glycerol-phosphate synthase subunit HisH
VIAIIDYGLGNLKSIKNALNEIGESSIITSDDSEIQLADGVILPGVGAFGYAMKKIKELDLENSIKKFVNNGKPLLGICLGFQLLFEKSFELGEFEGLGLIQGDVMKFPDSIANRKIIVPNVGWNNIFITKDNKLLNTPLAIESNSINKMYFVHSFFVAGSNPFAISTSVYEGINFTSAINRDNIYGVQFHPERSGNQGLSVLRNFINITRG